MRKKWIYLLLIPTALILITLLILSASAFWIISSFSRSEIHMALNRTFSERVQLVSAWTESGDGWPGFRFLLFHLMSRPAVLPMLVLFLLLILILIAFLAHEQKISRREQEIISRALEEQTKISSSLVLLDLKDRVNRFLQIQENRMIAQTERIRKQKLKYENVLHQLRSELNSILFVTHSDLQSSQISEIESIVEESDEMIKNCLMDSVFRETGIQDVIALAVSRKEKTLKAKNLKVRISADENVHLFGSFIWLNQLFQSALDNAADRSEEGTEVKIEIRKAGNEFVRIDISNHVTDVRPNNFKTGIPARYSSASETFDHFGIGMSMVDDIVRKHHGSASAELSERIFSLHLCFPVSVFESYDIKSDPLSRSSYSDLQD